MCTGQEVDGAGTGSSQWLQLNAQHKRNCITFMGTCPACSHAFSFWAATSSTVSVSREEEVYSHKWTQECPRQQRARVQCCSGQRCRVACESFVRTKRVWEPWLWRESHRMSWWRQDDGMRRDETARLIERVRFYNRKKVRITTSTFWFHWSKHAHVSCEEIWREAFSFFLV